MYPGRWVRQPVTLSLRFIQVFDLQGKFRPWRRGGTFACVLVATFAAVYGKAEAARLTLTSLHETFTEGFDTPEWQQAKALLDAARPSGQRD